MTYKKQYVRFSDSVLPKSAIFAFTKVQEHSNDRSIERTKVQNNKVNSSGPPKQAIATIDKIECMLTAEYSHLLAEPVDRISKLELGLRLKLGEDFAEQPEIYIRLNLDAYSLIMRGVTPWCIDVQTAVLQTLEQFQTAMPSFDQVVVEMVTKQQRIRTGISERTSTDGKFIVDSEFLEEGLQKIIVCTAFCSHLTSFYNFIHSGMTAGSASDFIKEQSAIYESLRSDFNLNLFTKISDQNQN